MDRASVPAMSAPASSSIDPGSRAPATVLDGLRRFGHWCMANAPAAAMLVALVGTLVWFYGGYTPLIPNDPHSFWRWAQEAWNEGNDLEHGPLILPGAIVVAWFQRESFAAVAKRSSWVGLLPLFVGIFIFVVAARAQQGRYALVALPVLILGVVWFLWGWPAARLASFPCGLLLFMVPIGFLLGHTEPLQRFVATAVTGLSNLVGVGIDRDGVNLIAKDRSFQCQVAGGCSGVRSLIAMTMLSLLYAYFNEGRFWKKVAIVATTLPATVLGNLVRVFTIILASKWFGEKFGTGPWHDISGFIITIPIAIGAMLGFHELLKIDFSKLTARWLTPEKPAHAPAATAEPGEAKRPEPGPISYDY
ncbi:MAG: exosortase/archaeosortase family protein [Chthoniobacteraceae bacterium]